MNLRFSAYLLFLPVVLLVGCAAGPRPDFVESETMISADVAAVPVAAGPDGTQLSEEDRDETNAALASAPTDRPDAGGAADGEDGETGEGPLDVALELVETSL